MSAVAPGRQSARGAPRPLFVALCRRAHALVLAAGAPVEAAWLAARLGLEAHGAGRLLGAILDGRFRLRSGVVSLWAWERPFPAAGETLVVLDLEATGGHPERDEILEVGAVRLAASGEYAEFAALNDPGRPIPPFIQGLTGITQEAVRGAPPLAETLLGLVDFVSGSTLVIQNAGSDLSFLNARFATLALKLDAPVVDTLDLARRALPGRRRRGLDALAWAYGIEARDRHRALGDARTTLAVARELHRSLAAGRDLSLRALHLETIRPPAPVILPEVHPE